MGLIIVIAVAVVFTHRKSGQSASPVTFTASNSSGTQAPKVSVPTQQSTTVFNDSDVSNALQSQSVDESLKSGNFTVLSNEQVVSGWYLVSVSVAGGQSEDEYIILKQDGNALTLVSGPGTAFSSSDLNAKGVPQAVQDKLLVSND